MAARMRFMAAVLAVCWVSQTWAAAEPNQPRRPDAPRPVADERMSMLRTMATSDRWMPQDAVTTLDRAIRQLDLTPEQTQKITGIQKSKDEVLATARKAYTEAGKALDEASSSGDDAAIRAAAVKVGNALADLQILRKKVVTELKAVLTPDQLKKLEEIRNQPIRPRQRGADGAGAGQGNRQGRGARGSQP
jgi:Spy/CpxP family protein refolding chaperone